MSDMIICLELTQDNVKGFEKLNQVVALKGKSIEVVHCWNDNNYPYPGELIVAYYPNKDQANQIEAEIKLNLDGFASKMSEAYDCKVVANVFRDSSPKKKMAKYIEESEASTAVTFVPTREGMDKFFHSSFSQHITNHTRKATLCIKLA